MFSWAGSDVYIYIYTMYLKNLPQQSVSSKKNLQVVDKFRKHVSCFYAQRKNVGVWAFKYYAFLCLLGGLPGIYFYDGRPKLFPIFC